MVGDTEGLPCAILIHSADIQDRDGGVEAIELAHAKYQSLKKIWADGGYAGNCIARVRDATGIELEIVRRTDGMSGELWLPEGQEPPVSEGFKVLKWRWIVERTFGWIGRNRRLSKDYEETLASSRAWVQLALIGLVARRLGASILWTHPLTGVRGSMGRCCCGGVAPNLIHAARPSRSSHPCLPTDACAPPPAPRRCVSLPGCARAAAAASLRLPSARGLPGPIGQAASASFQVNRSTGDQGEDLIQRRPMPLLAPDGVAP